MTNTQTDKHIYIFRSATATPAGITLLPPTLPLADPEPLFDPLSTLCLQLAKSLLQDLPPTDRSATGIILSTLHGSLLTDITFDRSRRDANARYASPAAFARTLPSTIPSELSLKLQLHGPLLVLSSHTPPNTSPLTLPLHRATSWMTHLNLPYCLAGTFDHAPNSPHPTATLLLLTPDPTNTLQPLLL